MTTWWRVTVTTPVIEEEILTIEARTEIEVHTQARARRPDAIVILPAAFDPGDLDDKRYTVQPEWCGKATTRWVVRFCDKWKGQWETEVEARGAAWRHKIADEQDGLDEQYWALRNLATAEAVERSKAALDNRDRGE